MEKKNVSLFWVLCLLSIPCAYTREPKVIISNDGKSDWCIAKSDAPSDALQRFIDYGCGVVNCSAIRPGGPCFEPSTLTSHATYVLDAVYKLPNATCNTDVGETTIVDPSYGECKYP